MCRYIPGTLKIENNRVVFSDLLAQFVAEARSTPRETPQYGCPAAYVLNDGTRALRQVIDIYLQNFDAIFAERLDALCN